MGSGDGHDRATCGFEFPPPSCPAILNVFALPLCRRGFGRAATGSGRHDRRPHGNRGLVELTNRDVAIERADGKQTFDFAKVRLIAPADGNEASHSVGGTGAGGTAADAAQQPTVWLETIDGSRIPGVGYAVTKGTAQLKLADGTVLDLPTKVIQLVEFRKTGDPPAHWAADVKSDLAADLLVVRKREGIDYVEGAAGNVTDASFNFNVDGDNVPVKRARVAGIVYFHPPDNPALPDPNCVFEDFSGFRLKAKSAALVDGQLKIVATFGGIVTRPLASLKLLDFSPGRMVYLSDLRPADASWTPYVDFGKQAQSLAQFYRPQEDHGLDGGPLRLSGKVYPKGLAIPSRTTLTYKIAGKGKRFEALAGIDDGVRETGQVRLVIRGDNKTLYDGKIIGRDPPVKLSLDVAGVKRLKILVDFGDGLDVGNYLDLCDARIVK